MDPGHFLCPECGGETAAQRIVHRPDPLPSPSEVTQNPWLGVLEEVVCAGCGFHVPSCLGELWDKLTPDRARDEWQQYYRAGAKRERVPGTNGAVPH